MSTMPPVMGSRLRVETSSTRMRSEASSSSSLSRLAATLISSEVAVAASFCSSSIASTIGAPPSVSSSTTRKGLIIASLGAFW
jgi:hypothetical protein